ncbi:MAG: helix-turn-helix transcriptional regulator [Suilimivivens sp.]
MLNRLLSIIYILLNKGTVTAGELAQRFEVSVRTIYRDVETLSMAGIPVYAKKGKNGGICLTEQFVLDKMLVSREEQQQILAALASVQETGAQDEGETLRKLLDFFKTEPANWVSIDFSDWSGRRKELFEQIKTAVLNHQVMQFDYYGQYGEMSRRTVEPVQLIFKDYTWYLLAFCRTRQAMRLFKVLRMKQVAVLGEYFADVKKPDETSTAEKSKKQETEFTEITLWIDKKEAYRIYDRFEEEEIFTLPDGNYQIRFRCLLDDWVYGVILSFGPSARVLAPEEIQREIRQRVLGMAALY